MYYLCASMPLDIISSLIERWTWGFPIRATILACAASRSRTRSLGYLRMAKVEITPVLLHILSYVSKTLAETEAIPGPSVVQVYGSMWRLACDSPARGYNCHSFIWTINTNPRVCLKMSRETRVVTSMCVIKYENIVNSSKEIWS